MHSFWRKLIALFVVTLLLPGVSLASPVNWTFIDSVFTTESTLTGTFLYDADTDVYSDIQITILPFSPMQADFTYTQSDFVLGDSGGFKVQKNGAGQVCSQGSTCYILDLSFISPLSNAGGNIGIGGTWDSVYSGGGGFGTYLTSGSVNASVVPIPAAVWLFGSGLGLLGWLRRRRTA